MARNTPPAPSSSAVPSSRLGRLARLGQMATGVAGNMLMAGARQLAQGCGGSLSVAADGPAFAAVLLLPAAQRVTVLAIDDHADAIQLLQRYVAGTRYQVFGARHAGEALALAGELSPRIIVLDVMMPEVDGWELLGRLQEHPLTRGVPVVACTIVAQEELAFALGVSAFLRKPVTRAAFLAVLDSLAPAP